MQPAVEGAFSVGAANVAVFLLRPLERVQVVHVQEEHDAAAVRRGRRHRAAAWVGRQRMFTGLLRAPDGSLVKLKLTRPFYVYPTSEPLDRTFLQVGRAGGLQPVKPPVPGGTS